MTPDTALSRGVDELALSLHSGACHQLLDYLRLLGKWNRTYNLTAIRDPIKMVSHHLLDSLAVIPHLPMQDGASLADAGSGAGLPGIPIAVARPGWRITLGEANEKKAAFLRQAIIELRLPNVDVHAGRVEHWQPSARFSLIVSRAFSDLAGFVGACKHLVAPAGTLAAMKGRYPDDELARLPAGFDCRVICLTVPHLRAERHLVLCRAAH